MHCHTLRPPLLHAVADFDNSIITATLPGPNRQVQVSIPIVDDMIIENQETFVGYIVIAEAIDPGTIELGRSATQLIINDNDSEYKESIAMYAHL